MTAKGNGIVAQATIHGDETQLQHLATVQAYKATLIPEPTPVKGGTWHGGMLWQLGEGHYVAILLPPVWRADRAMADYFGTYYDGDWAEFSRESFGDIQAVHLMPPWAVP